jgi:hypothetical protein
VNRTASIILGGSLALTAAAGLSGMAPASSHADTTVKAPASITAPANVSASVELVQMKGSKAGRSRPATTQTNTAKSTRSFYVKNCNPGQSCKLYKVKPGQHHKGKTLVVPADAKVWNRPMVRGPGTTHYAGEYRMYLPHVWLTTSR